MQKIVTCLFFDGKAEDAVRHYASIIKDTKIGTISRYGDSGPAQMPKGSVMTVEFEIAGQSLLALNGPPMFSFTPAISLIVNCETQDEIDHVWDKLSESGAQQQCGWLTDKFGVSWQIIPAKMSEWMRTANANQDKNLIAAMVKMTKLDMNVLKQAYEENA